MKTVFFWAIILWSFASVANTIELKTVSKNIVISGKTSQLYVDFEIPAYLTTYRTVEELSVCSRSVCLESIGNGKKGDWKNFFNVSRANKVSALASAVKGIGNSTAEKIDRHGLLTHKPDSWNEFIKEMRSIEKSLNKLGHRTNFSSEVIDVHGYDNRINLGYGSVQTCQDEKYSCVIPKVVESKVRVQDVKRTLKVIVENHQFQSYEQDVLKLEVSDNGEKVTVESRNYFHNYTSSFTDSGNTLLLKATRNKVYVPAHTIVGSAKKVFGRGLVNFEVTIPNQYVREDNPNAILNLYIIVRRDGRPEYDQVTVFKNVPTTFKGTVKLPGFGHYQIYAKYSKLDSYFFSSVPGPQMWASAISEYFKY